MAKSTKKDNSKRAGNSSKQQTKRSSAASIRSAGDHKKRDPVAIIEKTNEGRIPELLPIRHSRMGVSSFTFYRGAAAVMAADLSKDENSGIVVQCCGDCHILNCGAFATPERNIVIDLNDFDETHPAPFEWDLKRMATSIVLATANSKLTGSAGEDAAHDMIRSYQKEMALYENSRLLDIWYSRLDFQHFIEKGDSKATRKFHEKTLSKELMKSSPEMLHQKLIEKSKGTWRFKEMPPLLYHTKDVHDAAILQAYKLYLDSLPADRAALLRQYEMKDIAMKVVGTGSVGTFCAVVLLVGQNDDFIVLQVKEALQSVLEPYTKASEFKHHGQRVVVGQRIIQSASDMFLGWTTGELGRNFYVRQLRDVKLSPTPALWDKDKLKGVAFFAGKVLAKAHAKLGAAGAITEYIGKSDKFAKSMSKYAVSYAQQTEQDYELFIDACRSRRIPTESSAVG